MKKFEVSEEFIKEAHSAACSDWKKKIEEQFPDAFERPFFNFGSEYSIDTRNSDGPLMIGRGIAPAGKENKCLVVMTGWEVVTEEVVRYGSTYTTLSFKKKK